VDLKRLFYDLFESRRVRVTAENDRFELASTINDARGGMVGCIASIKART
jgi:hypothetical protein